MKTPQFLIDIIKNACSRYIEAKLLGVGIVTLAALKFYGLTTLSICYKMAFWIVFLFTSFFAMSLVFDFVYKQISEFKAYQYFCNISKNIDLNSSEQFIITALCRRNLRVFNCQMIKKGFFDEYIEYIYEKFNPNDKYIALIRKTETELETGSCVSALISNLENSKFIFKVKEMKDTYKINIFIWNYERKIWQKAKQNEDKKVQNFRKLINKQKR